MSTSDSAFLTVNRKGIQRYVIFLTLALGLSLCRAEQTNWPPPVPFSTWMETRIELGGAKGVIYYAAADFFARNYSTNRLTLVSLYPTSTNQPLTVKRYSDTKYTVVALPVPIGMESGLGTFAVMHNLHVIDIADRYVLAGDIQKAEEIYRLVDNCDPFGELKDDISLRLRLTRDISSGVNIQSNKIVFSKLVVNHAPSIFGDSFHVEKIESTNLLGMNFKDVWKSTHRSQFIPVYNMDEVSTNSSKKEANP